MTPSGLPLHLTGHDLAVIRMALEEILLLPVCRPELTRDIRDILARLPEIS